MANITIGHGPNIARFVRAKGIELNVETMNNSMVITGPVKKGVAGSDVDYDVANGAAVLMTNTCFKRDDMKELFGKKAAPEAIMSIIKKYQPSKDPDVSVKQFRCLISMYKAISNLALFVPNVDIFISRQIDELLFDFFRKAESMPDNLLEAALRTVSNLCMENTDGAMDKFGKLVTPILQNVLNNGNTQRCSFAMFALSFEVLGFLSRYEKNGQQFVKDNGIPTVLKVVNNNIDFNMYGQAIYVLGIQAAFPASLKSLITHGLFSFLSTLLNELAAAEVLNIELSISSLRCIRRCLKTKEYIDSFIETGGVASLVTVLGRGDAHAMVHMDAHRVLIACLVHNPPPVPPTQAKTSANDGWDCDDIADEGVLGAVASLARPPSPRSWESIGLDSGLVKTFIIAVCCVLEKDDAVTNLRMLRCALGLLAYFACEKLEGTVDAFYSGNICSSLDMIFGHYKGDASMVLTGCYLINNLAYASEPEAYLQLRKEKSMRSSLKEAISTFPKDRASDKSFCELTYQLLHEKSLDPLRFAIHMQWDYPFSLTDWDKDKYPNGVQDLPQDMREEIRAGDKCKILLDKNKSKDTFHWKSSMDMCNLTWRVDAKEGYHPFSLSISGFKLMSKNPEDSTILRDMAAEGKKLSSSTILTLVGPVTEDYPKGVNLTLQFVTSRSRDRLFQLLTEWREAATYGF